jgi:cysteinyl-tRNA synthetase
VTIRELLADWPGEVLRLNMLKTHYRSPIDWTIASLEESRRVLDSWYDIIGDDTRAIGEVDEDLSTQLRDDLNTSGAITRLHAIASSRIGTPGQLQIDVKRKLKVSAMLLGLLGRTKKEHLASDPKAILVDKDAVNASVDARNAARARKDFKESDRIRDELAAIGVVLKDGKDADGKPVTSWEIAR